MGGGLKRVGNSVHANLILAFCSHMCEPVNLPLPQIKMSRNWPYGGNFAPAIKLEVDMACMQELFAVHNTKMNKTIFAFASLCVCFH